MQADQIFQWAFESLIALVALYSSNNLSKMSTSIEALNEHIATLLEKTAWHEKVLDRHEQDIENLKQK